MPGRDRSYALGRKSSLAKEGNPKGNLEKRTTKGGSLGNDRNDIPLFLSRRDIQNKCRAVFWASPRSTSQTSPRLGIFLLVQHRENAASRRGQFLIRNATVVEKRCPVDDYGAKFLLLIRRKPFKLREQLCRCSAHG